MLDLQVTNKYKKDIKLMYKQNKDKDKINDIIDMLINEQTLPEKYKDHVLTGNYIGSRECHIEPDWLLIYIIDIENNRVILERTGSHSNLFETWIAALNRKMQKVLSEDVN